MNRQPVSIEFTENQGTFTGTGRLGRRWRISPTRTGWRLEFLDPGDAKATNAGVFGTVEAAQNAAMR